MNDMFLYRQPIDTSNFIKCVIKWWIFSLLGKSIVSILDMNEEETNKQKNRRILPKFQSFILWIGHIKLEIYWIQFANKIVLLKQWLIKFKFSMWFRKAIIKFFRAFFFSVFLFFFFVLICFGTIQQKVQFRKYF